VALGVLGLLLPYSVLDSTKGIAVIMGYRDIAQTSPPHGLFNKQ
jgi:hypothetical protein